MKVTRKTEVEVQAVGCPFCSAGETRLTVDKKVHNDAHPGGVPVTQYRVCCNSCGAYGPHSYDEDIAINLWNGRS